jgi:ADP-ribose pyrophosphatase
MKREPRPGDPSKPWSATAAETLLSNPYFKVLRQQVTVNDGTQREYHTIDYATPAVGVVARRGTDTLLVRQYRFIVDEFVWAIPSGGVAVGETIADAAERELEEETGYRAKRMNALMYCYASYGSSNQRYEIFLGDDLERTDGQVDANEVLEVKWFARDELIRLILDNGVVDNLSLSPLLLVLLRDGMPVGPA